MLPIRIVFRKYNPCFLSHIMFFLTGKNMIFRVLISVVYFTIQNYVCADICDAHKLKFMFQLKDLEYNIH